MIRRTIFFAVCCLLLMACPPLPHQMMNRFNIEYSSTGKGGSEYIQIHKRKLLYVQNQQDTIRKKLQKKTYVQLYELFQNVSLDSLPYLPVPSKRHQFDGASAAALTISDFNSNQYQSPTFDHDNPPEKIKELIAYIKELTKK
jgi:hypothetical protein